MSNRVSNSGRGFALTSVLHVRTGTARVDKKKDALDFLNSWQRACWWSSPMRPCVCVCVSVCYCWERQGLASEVIRAAACLSLSLQPENTLLFRTTLTAPLPLPRCLSSQKLWLVVSENHRGEEREGRRRAKGCGETEKQQREIWWAAERVN